MNHSVEDVACSCARSKTECASAEKDSRYVCVCVGAVTQSEAAVDRVEASPLCTWLLRRLADDGCAENGRVSAVYITYLGDFAQTRKVFVEVCLIMHSMYSCV